MIVGNDIRWAEKEIRKTLELGKLESAVFYTSNLVAIDPLSGDPKYPECNIPQKICWGSQFKTVSILYPIYRDGEKENGLFGYLELTLRPNIDFTVVSVLVLLLLMAFIGQAFGLSSRIESLGKADC